MNWTISADDTLYRSVAYPVFEPETKKEKKYAKRMNGFYGDIITAIINNADEKGYKCHIRITADKNDEETVVFLIFRARLKGKTIKEFSHKAIWKNGIIISQEKQ